MFSINLVSLYCLCIDKGGGGGLEMAVIGVFLFFCVPLVIFWIYLHGSGIQLHGLGHLK